jgi:hypothetical protein
MSVTQTIATSALLLAVLVSLEGVATASAEVVRPRTQLASAGWQARTASCASDVRSGRLFSRASFWNKPLSQTAAIDPRSRALVRNLRRQAKSYHAWINTDRFSTPLYIVGRKTRRRRVKLDTVYPALQKTWKSVPIPAHARAARGTDKHMAIWQPATDTMWEFWLMRRVGRRWHARWGGTMRHVSRNPGFYGRPETHWGATGTSLPVAGGLMTIDELRRGRICHALAMAIPETRIWTVWAWPAQRSDGHVRSARAIPEGARFRLDPDLDIKKLHLPPMTRMIAEAAQRYGIVIRDKAGAVVFYGEDPARWSKDPYYGSDGIFAGQWPDTLLARFPWRHLELLRMRLHTAAP